MDEDNFLKKAELSDWDLERLSYLLDRYMVWFEGSILDDVENGFANELERLYDYIEELRSRA